ncbi:MAG: PEP-utilizing enzyme [Rhodothalassiaceae bacterium]
MRKLYVDTDKYGGPAASPVVEAFHAVIKDIVRKKWAESGLDWQALVFDASYDLIIAEELQAAETALVEEGHRFDWSAVVSVQERPEIYKPGPDGGDADKDFSFDHPDAPTQEADGQGRALRGVGDNVVKHSANTSGIARYVRTSERVMQYLNEGVPPDTIAIIDDSGGTLTAPVLEGFKGVLCAGGSVRSHLGILTREYGIPCLMNAKITGIKEGDRVEMESSADAKTAEAYQKGLDMPAKIWVLHAGS